MHLWETCRKVSLQVSSSIKWPHLCTYYIYFKMQTYINAYCHQCEHTCCNREYGDKVGHFTVEFAERPVSIQHVNKIEDDIQRGHHDVGQTEIHQEVIGHCPLCGEYKARSQNGTQKCMFYAPKPDHAADQTNAPHD